MRALATRLAPLLRKVLPEGSAPYRALQTLNRRFGLYDHPILAIVRSFAKHHPEVFFVQVGSNDGDQLDPLRDSILRHGWGGIMIEPVPYVFRRLEKNCGSLPGVILENVAIAAQEGSMPFYHLPEAAPGEDLPRLYDALGSFDRDVVLKHEEFIPGIAEKIVVTNVETLSFDSLTRKHGVDRIDLLHIDTEGYDFEVLKTVDFDRWTIPLLIYENLHLSPEDKQSCEQMLSGHGYELFALGLDTVALRTRTLEIPEALQKVFRRQAARFARSAARRRASA